MKLINILDEDLVQFPIKAHDENAYYPSYISVTINEYINLLRDYSVSDEIIDSISEFKEKIFLTLSEYYGGDHFNSYKRFKEAMEVFEDELKDWITEIKEDEFYRARINTKGNKDFMPDEMFHIPFEQRTKVATQRYSSPGLPCLYLGASPYVCWLELDRPSIDSFNVARLEKKEGQSIRVLDLSKTPNSIKSEYLENKSEDKLLSYLKLWPLIAVCSVTVKEENGNFKPEYIISQMLLQWLIIEIDLLREYFWADGIKFFSIKATSNTDSLYQLKLNYPRLYVNYVFPIRKSQKQCGFCERLQDKFVITSSISGRTIQSVVPQRNAGIFIDDNLPEDYSKDEEIVLPDGRTTLYSRSSFSWFEKILEHQEKITSLDGDIFLKY